MADNLKIEDLKKILFSTAKEYNERVIKVSDNPQKGREMLIWNSMATGIEDCIVKCGLFSEYLDYYESEVQS